MAKRGDKTVILFMENVMKRVGAENPTELSKVMGGPWVERDQQRRLYKWAAGEQSPNFLSTVELLAVAGCLRWNPLTGPPPRLDWLDEAAIEPRTEQEVERKERAPTDRLGALREAVAEVQSILKDDVLADLADVRTRLERLEARESQQQDPPKGRRRATSS